MGFQSSINQAIGTVGAVSGLKKVIQGQEETVKSQKESNELSKQQLEAQEQANTLLAIEEADKLNKEGLENEEAIKGNEEELEGMANEVDATQKKQMTTSSPIWKKHYDKAMQSLNDRIMSLNNINNVMKTRQTALEKKKEILSKQTQGKLDEFLYFGEGKEDRRYGKE